MIRLLCTGQSYGYTKLSNFAKQAFNNAAARRKKASPFGQKHTRPKRIGQYADWSHKLEIVSVLKYQFETGNGLKTNYAETLLSFADKQ